MIFHCMRTIRKSERRSIFKTIYRPSQNLDVMKRWKNLRLEKLPWCRLMMTTGEIFKKCDYISVIWTIQCNTAPSKAHMGDPEKRSNGIFNRFFRFFSNIHAEKMRRWTLKTFRGKKSMPKIVWWCGIGSVRVTSVQSIWKCKIRFRFQIHVLQMIRHCWVSGEEPLNNNDIDILVKSIDAKSMWYEYKIA